MRGVTLVAATLILIALSARAGTIEIRVERARDRQVIDGFGGSLAYWGYNADETALRLALEDLGATIVRIPAEAASARNPDAYREVLRRVARVAPEASVYLTFWQPRSNARPGRSDWLDTDDSGKYRLKPALTTAWAEEMVGRVVTIRRDWGANVVAVGVQNEPNFSVPGTPTCAWEPDRLADFTAYEFVPRLIASGMGPLLVAAPELAYTGDNAGEARRFAPVLAGPSVAIFSYHMYDSYKEGEPDPGLDGVRARQQALGRFLRENLPAKRVWMTETTGAQYNGKEWHTLGWSAALDEHDKAIAAARYMHAALVDAGANAFLWWGLIYSAPPTSVKGEQERQKFRDEGLILVEPESTGGTHRFLERTPKSYVFQQFARFVRPGWVRLDVTEPAEKHAPLVAAFRKEDGRQVAVVLINPDRERAKLDTLRVTGAQPFRLERAFVTDRRRLCEPAEWAETLPPESVTTLLFREDRSGQAAGVAK
jgi:O-glycosyl hydrolase